jgi:hypothetical protein
MKMVGHGTEAIYPRYGEDGVVGRKADARAGAQRPHVSGLGADADQVPAVGEPSMKPAVRVRPALGPRPAVLRTLSAGEVYLVKLAYLRY